METQIPRTFLPQPTLKLRLDQILVWFSHAESCAAGRRSARGAYTLFEVLLVLTLLVIIASLTVPILSGAIDHSRLQQAGEQLQSAWATARLEALETGQTQVFRCLWGTSRFDVAPLTAQQMMQPDELNYVQEDYQVDEAHRMGIGEYQLRSGVTFLLGRSETTLSSATNTSTDVNMIAHSQEGQWSAPVLFRSDGTSSNALVVLENSRGQQLQVALRGLTGMSRLLDAQYTEGSGQ